MLVFLRLEHGIIYLRGDTMIKRDEKGNIVDNPRIKDKTGQRFGRLVVKEIDLNKASRKHFGYVNVTVEMLFRLEVIL